jgi:hypothetical protein
MHGFALVLALVAATPSAQVLEVHPGLPPLEFRILPGPPSQNAWNIPRDQAKDPHWIGHVKITRKGEKKPFQTIRVLGYGSPMDLDRSRFADVNFDGYTDLLLGHDGGAIWEGYEIYFYDPASGSFIQNALSREMSEKLAGHNLDFHPEKKEIVVTHFLGSSSYSQTFVLRDGTLEELPNR